MDFKPHSYSKQKLYFCSHHVPLKNICHNSIRGSSESIYPSQYRIKYHSMNSPMNIGKANNLPIVKAMNCGMSLNSNVKFPIV